MSLNESVLEVVCDLERLQCLVDQMGYDVAAAYLAAAIDSLRVANLAGDELTP